MFHNLYPYTDFHELNLDWIIRTIKALNIRIDDFTALNSIKWAGYWDPSKAYDPYTIVRTASHAYLSLKAVPANILITNGDYWAEIFDYSVIDSIELQATGDTTDRTADIEAALNMYGRVILGAGDFYTTGITMPTGSIIKGAGNDSRIILDPLVASGSAVHMGARCQLSNIRISGNLTDFTPDGAIGTRHGVLWTVNTMQNGDITNCVIENFTGAAVYLYDTGTNVDRGLMITACMIRKSNVGIYFRRNTEYNKVTGCSICFNYYGILNRGGNNTISGCGIDGNYINVQEDEAEGGNGGRMTLSGCSLNHADDAGYSLYIKGSGAIVSGCQFNYGHLFLENAQYGVAVVGCIFGQNAPITFQDGNCNILDSCIMRSDYHNPVTFDNAPTAKINNCYHRDGTAVVPTVI